MRVVKDDNLYLIHIMESIEHIESYTKAGRDEFMKNSMIQDAVVRNFEIIGEAAKRLSNEFKEKSQDIPWRRISGFRDILIHQYMGVNPAEVWNIIKNDLPALKAAVKITE